MLQIERIDVPLGRHQIAGGMIRTGETESVLVLCDDLFAIRPGRRDAETDEQLFNLTHRPTGYCVIESPWDYVLEILKEIQARGTERWQFSDPAYAAGSLLDEFRDIQAVARRATGRA